MIHAWRPALLMAILALMAGCARVPVPTGETFDPVYTEFNRLLVAHVSDEGVDWAGLTRERSALDCVCKRLAMVTPAQFDAMTRDEQLAYLINVFNANALNNTIPLFFASAGEHPSPGDLKRLASRRDVACLGRYRSLAWIERHIMRDYHEPRAIFLLGPGRADRPYPPPFAATGETLEALAERQTAQFFRRPAAYRYEGKTDKLYLNRLLRQYRGPVEGTYTKLIYFAQRYMTESDRRLTEKREPRIRWLDADASFAAKGIRDGVVAGWNNRIQP